MSFESVPRTEAVGNEAQNTKALIKAINTLIQLSRGLPAAEDAIAQTLNLFEKSLELERRGRYSSMLALSLAIERRIRPGPTKASATALMAARLSVIRR